MMEKRNKPIRLIKYDGSVEDFSKDLLILLLYRIEKKSVISLTPELREGISKYVEAELYSLGKTLYDIGVMHRIVLSALDNYDSKVADCYREYVENEKCNSNRRKGGSIKDER